MPEKPTPTRTASAWKGPAIGLLDLDSFFASVELLDHPEWRGKPVIVGGSPDKRGVVSTASYEARKYGVHSAMASAQAARLCPNAIWVRGNYARYREMSNQVMDILVAETPLVEQVSIDEAFFDVSPGRFSNEDPVAICARIQDEVDKLGITCSIGLGTNKTIAKIASERDKPHGFTAVHPGLEEAFLSPLPVREMSGIGGATEAKLHELGIHTLGELAAADPDTISKHFGVSGPRMILRASGREVSSVSAIDEHEDAKSVSNERTFAEDLTSTKEVYAAISHVASLVGTRLRKKGLKGRCVTLKIKPDATHTRSSQTHLAHATDDETLFGQVAKDLLADVWEEGSPVRLVGVAISDFSHKDEQLELFSEEPDAKSTPDRRNLAVAADEIRERFGDAALSFGREVRLKGGESDTVPQNK